MSTSKYTQAVVLTGIAAVAACDRGGPEMADTAGDVAAIEALLGQVEAAFESADLNAAITAFTDDAVILGPGGPDIVGTDAIRATYAGMLAQFDVDTELTSAEIQVAGDLAYERGTYTLKLTDKTTGQVVADVENRHLHIMKRQSDGGWKTWRMMVNSAEPPAEAPRN